MWDDGALCIEFQVSSETSSKWDHQSESSAFVTSINLWSPRIPRGPSEGRSGGDRTKGSMKIRSGFYQAKNDGGRKSLIDGRLRREWSRKRNFSGVLIYLWSGRTSGFTLTSCTASGTAPTTSFPIILPLWKVPSRKKRFMLRGNRIDASTGCSSCEYHARRIYLLLSDSSSDFLRFRTVTYAEFYFGGQLQSWGAADRNDDARSRDLCFSIMVEKILGGQCPLGTLLVPGSFEPIGHSWQQSRITHSSFKRGWIEERKLRSECTTSEFAERKRNEIFQGAIEWHILAQSLQDSARTQPSRNGEKKSSFLRGRWASRYNDQRTRQMEAVYLGDSAILLVVLATRRYYLYFPSEWF